MNKIEEMIARRFKEFQGYRNVLSIKHSTKIVHGLETNQPCITFYVSKKDSKGFVVPKEIEGNLTDVVELSSIDYELGNTSMSSKSPEQQKKMSNGVKKQWLS